MPRGVAPCSVHIGQVSASFELHNDGWNALTPQDNFLNVTLSTAGVVRMMQ